MDSEAAVIRSEMNQTRAELDRKIARLAARAQEYHPREVVRRRIPDYLAERVIGSLLTVAGLTMAWSHYRKRQERRQQMQTAFSGVCW